MRLFLKILIISYTMMLLPQAVIATTIPVGQACNAKTELSFASSHNTPSNIMGWCDSACSNACCTDAASYNPPVSGDGIRDTVTCNCGPCSCEKGCGGTVITAKPGSDSIPATSKTGSAPAKR